MRGYASLMKSLRKEMREFSWQSFEQIDLLDISYEILLDRAISLADEALLREYVITRDSFLLLAYDLMSEGGALSKEFVKTMNNRSISEHDRVADLEVKLRDEATSRIPKTRGRE